MAKKFYFCRCCGKKLIERMPNGLWKFIFGSYKSEDKTEFNIPEGEPPVEMLVYGSVKMRCIRKTCRQWNTLHFFPSSDILNLLREEKSSSISDSEVLALDKKN